MEFLGQPIDIPVFVTEEMAAKVETHGQGMGYDAWPAVNVKVHMWMDDAVLRYRDGKSPYPTQYPEAFLTWAATLEYDDHGCMAYEQVAREMGWSDAEAVASELFDQTETPVYVQVESAGRCGGWMLLKNLDHPRDWAGGGEHCPSCGDELPRHDDDCEHRGPWAGQCDVYAAYQTFSDWAQERAENCLSDMLELIWLNDWDHDNNRPLHPDEELTDA